MLPVIVFHVQTLEIMCRDHNNVAVHFIQRHFDHRIQRFHFIPQIFVLVPDQGSRNHRDIVGDQRHEFVLNQPDLTRAGCDVEAEPPSEIVLQLSKVRILILLSLWRRLLLWSHGIVGGTMIFGIGTVVFIAHASLTLDSTFVVVVILLVAAIAILIALAAVTAVIVVGFAPFAARVASVARGERGKNRRLGLVAYAACHRKRLFGEFVLSPIRFFAVVVVKRAVFSCRSMPCLIGLRLRRFLFHIIIHNDLR